MKICSKCKQVKRLSSFFKRKRGSSDGRMSACKVCKTIAIYRWREANPEKNALVLANSYKRCRKNGTWAKRFSTHPVRRSIYRMKERYGLTQQQFAAMLKKQSRRCAICQEKLKKDRKMLAVDHCHKTQKVRGLLCHMCNWGLGSFRDNIEIMQCAISYLQARQARKLAGLS